MIVDQLRREVSGMTPGARFASENELASRFGVSRPTAAHALQELSNSGLVMRRVGSGTYVGDAAANLRGGGTALKTFGVMLPGLGATEVWDPLSRYIDQACSALDITRVVGPEEVPHDDIAATTAQAEWLIERGVDGVLLAPMESVADRERANLAICARFTDAGLPVVLVDRDVVEYPGRSDFDVVGMDSARAGALMGAHLAAQGFTRPVFLSRPLFPSTTDLRVAGCAYALARGGVSVRRDWHVTGDPADMAWVSSALDEHNADVVVCSNDRTAAILIQTLMREGRRVPDDVAVVGFDDAVYSELLSITLTTVAQPFSSIARAAVRRLADRVAEPGLDPVEILLPPRLVVRDSSTPNSAGGGSVTVTGDANLPSQSPEGTAGGRKT